MIRTPHPRVLSVSDRAYRALLYLYPTVHRREYGPLMARFFRDLCWDALREGGLPGLAGLWTRTMIDTARNAVVEHMDQKGDIMKTLRLTAALSAIAGVALLAANALSIYSLLDIWWTQPVLDFDWTIVQIGFLLAFPFHLLIAVTLYRWYGVVRLQGIAGVPRKTLMISIVAGILSALGIVGQFASFHDISDGQPLLYEWVGVLLGFALVTAFQLSTAATLYSLFKHTARAGGPKLC